MWRPIHLSFLALAIQSTPVAGETRWPNPHIPVPPLVHRYIVGECRDHQGTTHESLDACIHGERYGYRAVVMMLVDEETGEQAAERYRQCRSGVGDLGGRFHRNRATCIGGSLSFKWRFEFSQEAALRGPAASHGALSEEDGRTAATDVENGGPLSR